MRKKKHVFLLLAMILMYILFASSVYGSFQFEFRVHDYAKEGLFYYPLLFKVDIENTGTEADTIDLDLTKNLPPGWYADLCVRGKCVQDHIEIDLLAGQSDSILVDIYLGGAQDVGSVILTGTMRSEPLETHSVILVGFCAQPSILLVDDDNGGSYETYLAAAIDSAGYKAWIWDVSLDGRPGSSQLNSYWSVFWTTADGDAAYITSTDESDWIDFLENGGNLFLASMNYLSSRGSSTTFISDYLHIGGWDSDVGAASVGGVSGDAISDGMSLSLGSSPFTASETDIFVSTSPSETIFTASGGVGLKVAEASHKLVFLSFPFEPIVNSSDPHNQKTLISRVIEWFGPYEASVGRDDMTNAALGLSISPNPFTDRASIWFGKASGNGNRRLAIYDVKGCLIRSLLVSGNETSAIWDGKDERGRSIPSGIYFVRLSNGQRGIVHKIVLTR